MDSKIHEVLYEKIVFQKAKPDGKLRIKDAHNVIGDNFTFIRKYLLKEMIEQGWFEKINREKLLVVK